MSSGLYSTKTKEYDQHFDPTKVSPYGDTMNDGQVQISFTLPLKDNDRATEAAKQLAMKMGLVDPLIAAHIPLDEEFTNYVVYGSVRHTVNMDDIKVEVIEQNVLSMPETDDYIREHIGKKVIVVGASTGTDAHTVGIDAIMNMKGYAGHYGLERYDMIDAHNLGSQVPNEEFIEEAIKLGANVLLVSQTVTQKDVHVKNMTELVELLEAKGLRDKVVLIAGGPRITNDLAKEIGFDAGFGPGKYADDVATFFCEALKKRELIK